MQVTFVFGMMMGFGLCLFYSNVCYIAEIKQYINFIGPWNRYSIINLGRVWNSYLFHTCPMNTSHVFFYFT